MEAFSFRSLNSDFGLWHADDHGASAGQFFVRDFRHELQVEAKTCGFLTCYVVEEVNHVSAKSILGSPAFVEVEGAYRIDFQFAHIAQDGAELALKLECSLAHLRHGKSHHVIGHRSRPSIAEDARSVQCSFISLLARIELEGDDARTPVDA